MYGIGYTAGAWVLGRTGRAPSPSNPVVLAGWGTLRLVALVPVFGGLTCFAAVVVVGLGSIQSPPTRSWAAPPVPARPAP